MEPEEGVAHSLNSHAEEAENGGSPAQCPGTNLGVVKPRLGLTSIAIHSFIHSTNTECSLCAGPALGVETHREGDRCASPPSPRPEALADWGRPSRLWGRASGHTVGLLSPQWLLFLTPQLITGLKFLGTSPGTMGPASLSSLLSPTPQQSTDSWELRGLPVGSES